MLRHRRLRRTTLVASAIALLVSAAPSLATAAAAGPVVKPIIFPVNGSVTYTDTFGACRDGCARRHEGQDLMGKKMLPLLAAVDGIVHRVSFNNTVGNSVTLKAADGWTYHYIHVNNDTPGTDDGKATRAQAFPANIVAGAKVTKGQVVAYLGDSGNAEGGGSHLHFEIRQPAAAGSYQGVAINAYASLKAATHWSATSQWNLRRTADTGPSDEQFTYGLQAGDKGLLCDWDGDGADEAVIYRSGTWHLRDGTNTGASARQLPFGTASDTPLCGNVDGDPGDEPLLFRTGTWTVRTGFGLRDPFGWASRYGMQAGDQPVVGDWDGDGDDDFGIHRAGTWHVRSTGTLSGVTVATFPYGVQAGDRPVAGDWDGDGDDDAGIFRGGQWHLRSSAEAIGAGVRMFTFGAAGQQPVVGHGSDPVLPGVGTFRPRT